MMRLGTITGAIRTTKKSKMPEVDVFLAGLINNNYIIFFVTWF